MRESAGGVENRAVEGGDTMRQVKTLGLLGTGVIGGGWAARALHFGIDVLAADVKPEMETWIRGAVANAEGALSRLTFAPLPGVPVIETEYASG